MYISIVIFTPLLICLWICFLIFMTENIFKYNCASNSDSNPKNITKPEYSNYPNTSAEHKGMSDESYRKKHVHIPKVMLELYEKNRIETKNLERADIVRSLIPTHMGPVENNEIFESPSENHILQFDIPVANEDEKFVSAELKILTLLADTEDDERLKRNLKVSVCDESPDIPSRTFLEMPIEQANNTWVSFDVTNAVHNILKSNKKGKLLSVTVTVSSFVQHDKGQPRLSLMPEEGNIEFDYPVLLLSYLSVKEDSILSMRKKIRTRRTKRSTEEDYEEESNRLWDDESSARKDFVRKLKKTRNNCRRRQLYIDFAEINYDSWIVQPKGYEAYQCLGRCFYPVAEHLNPTKHAIVQALLHSVAPSRVTRSCCVPTELDPISILYVDLKGVLTYRYAYKDMVVAECGCR